MGRTYIVKRYGHHHRFYFDSQAKAIGWAHTTQRTMGGDWTVTRVCANGRTKVVWDSARLS